MPVCVPVETTKADVKLTPAAVHACGEVQDMASTKASSSVFSVAMPGTCCARPQVPSVSVTTKGWLDSGPVSA
jgi:hypothetical protein